MINEYSSNIIEIKCWCHCVVVVIICSMPSAPRHIVRAKLLIPLRAAQGATGKLEAAGYIEKEWRGRENLYRLTDFGKYVACVSGRL